MKVNIDKIPEIAAMLPNGLPQGVIWDVLYGNRSVDQALDAYTDELDIAGVEEPDWLADWDLDDTEKTMEIVNVMTGNQEPDMFGAGGPTPEAVATAVEQRPELVDLAAIVEEQIEDPNDLDEFEMLMADIDDASLKLDEGEVDAVMALLKVADETRDPTEAFQIVSNAILQGEKNAFVQGADAGGFTVYDDELGDDEPEEDLHATTPPEFDIYGGYTDDTAYGAMVRHAMDFRDMTLTEAKEWAKGGPPNLPGGAMFGGLPDEAAMWEMYELDPEDENQLYKLDTSGWKDPPPDPVTVSDAPPGLPRTPWTQPPFSDWTMGQGDLFFVGEDSLFGDERALATWDEYFSTERSEYEMYVLAKDWFMEDEPEPTFGEYTTDRLRTALSGSGDKQNEIAASLFHWLYKNIQDGTLDKYEGGEGFRDLHGVISNVLTGDGITQEYSGEPLQGNYLPGIITLVPGLGDLLTDIYDPQPIGPQAGEKERGKNVYSFPPRDIIENHIFQFASRTKLDWRTKGGVDYLESLIEANRDQRDVFDRAFRETHPGLTGSWYEGQKRGLFIDAMTDRYFSLWDDEATTYEGYAGDTPQRSKTPFVADEDWFSSWLQNRAEHQTNLFSNVETLADFLHENRWNFEGEDYARAGLGEGVLEGQQVQDVRGGGGKKTEGDVDKEIAKRLKLDLDDTEEKRQFYQFKAFNPLLHRAGSGAHEGAITAIKQAAISALTPVGASAASRSYVAKKVDRDYDTFTSTGQGSPLSFLKYALGRGRVVSSKSTLLPEQGALWRETEEQRQKRLAGTSNIATLRLPGGQQVPLF